MRTKQLDSGSRDLVGLRLHASEVWSLSPSITGSEVFTCHFMYGSLENKLISCGRVGRGGKMSGTGQTWSYDEHRCSLSIFNVIGANPSPSPYSRAPLKMNLLTVYSPTKAC